MPPVAPDLEDLLTRMDAVLQNAEGDLTVQMGGLTEPSRVHVWQGQVLVDWERDEEAGGCLLRPALVRRLVQLGARLEARDDCHRIVGSAPVVAALSPYHQRLASQLGRPPALELTLRLDALGGAYLGGEERYLVRGPGGASTMLLLTARLRPRPPSPSPRTPPGPS